MKKLMFLGVAAMMLATTFFISCEKEEVQSNNDSIESYNRTSENDFSPKADPGDLELSEDEIVNIGELHNDILQSVFENFDESYQIEELIFEMTNIEIANLNNDIRNEVINTSTYDKNYLINNLNDDLSLEYCEKITNFILSSNNIEDLNEKLLDLSNEINTDDRRFNKTVPLLFIEVSKKSASFWSSSLGSNIIVDQDIQGLSPWVKGLIAADGLGAAGAFTGYGLLAGVTGPMGWGALLATVGFSAAWSSASYALTT